MDIFMPLLIEKIRDAEKSENNDYTTISVRLPIEIACMVDVMAIMAQEQVINLFSDDLSLQLASFLLENSDNIDLIKEVLQEKHKELQNEQQIEYVELNTKGSCIEKLEEYGAINLKYELFRLKVSKAYREKLIE